MDAGGFSGIIVIPVKINRTNTLVVLHELLQGLVGHASKGEDSCDSVSPSEKD
jgi:hypothetical protein